MAWFNGIGKRAKKLITPVSKPTESNAPLFFTNTLSGKKEIFSPLRAGNVTMYSCGPTVYSKAHIGNLRAYIFADLVARVTEMSGFHVRRVINITDVGHLVSDGDEGEDKMELGAKREGLSAEAIAARYTKMAIDDMHAVGLDTDSILFPRATDYIKEQIQMIRTLEEKGYAYRTHDGIYFDTHKFGSYGKLGNLSESHTREEAFASIGRRISENKDKHQPADFALWKFSPVKERRLQEWDSPWGRGFPGWHIECSAMSRSLLGETIDIHTGGMDLIPIHHNDEIAQSESISGKPFVRYWIHSAFLTMEGEKVSKSIGNVVYLSDITERGFHPLSLRYFYLQAHYRTPISFSWDAIKASDEALHRLWRLSRDTADESKRIARPSELSRRMVALLRDDLSTAQALALLWEVLKDDDLAPADKWAVLECAESVLGLSLISPPGETKVSLQDLPEDVQSLMRERDIARMNKNFMRSDEIRYQLQERGYRVDDGPSGTMVTRLPG